MKKYNIIKLVVFIILAIMLLIFRNYLSLNIKYLVGPLLLIYGMDILIKHFIKKDKFSMRNEFFLGIMEITLGLVILIFLNNEVDSSDYVTICVVWAVWTITREGIELEKHSKKIIFGNALGIIDTIESIVSIVFSIILLINPVHEYVMIHIILLVIELLCRVLIPLLDIKFEKKNNEDEND